jgi:hypothetical protein
MELLAASLVKSNGLLTGTMFSMFSVSIKIVSGDAKVEVRKMVRRQI